MRFIILIVALFLGHASYAIDFNNDKNAIDDIKGQWRLYYIDVNGKFYSDSLSINETRFFLDAGYAGKGSNFIEQIFFNGYGSEITCFYTNKPLNFFNTKYGCIDTDARNLNYYEFNLDNGVIRGTLGFKADRNTGKQISYYPKFMGIYQGKTDEPVYGDYRSDYQLIQWNKRGDNNRYCIDITDEHWNIYPGFQAIKCDDQLANFSPIDYVRNVLHTELPKGVTFYWRVWSAHKDDKGAQSNDHYGGPGYEGKVVVP